MSKVLVALILICCTSLESDSAEPKPETDRVLELSGRMIYKLDAVVLLHRLNVATAQLASRGKAASEYGDFVDTQIATTIATDLQMTHTWVVYVLDMSSVVLDFGLGSPTPVTNIRHQELVTEIDTLVRSRLSSVQIETLREQTRSNRLLLTAVKSDQFRNEAREAIALVDEAIVFLGNYPRVVPVADDQKPPARP